MLEVVCLVQYQELVRVVAASEDSLALDPRPTEHCDVLITHALPLVIVIYPEADDPLSHGGASSISDEPTGKNSTSVECCSTDVNSLRALCLRVGRCVRPV